MPVYVVDDPFGRFVEVAVEESLRFHSGSAGPDVQVDAEQLTRLGLHQPVFRARVLAAYERRCGICRLKHVDLDMAHSSGTPRADSPWCPTGWRACSTTPRTDGPILGVRPDDVVQVRAEVLEEVDGPMPRPGLQDVHGWRLEVPSRIADRPDRELLGQRWSTFSSLT